MENLSLGAFGNGSHIHHGDEPENVVNCGAVLSRVHKSLVPYRNQQFTAAQQTALLRLLVGCKLVDYE